MKVALVLKQSAGTLTDLPIGLKMLLPKAPP